ncbi:MAG: peptidylprolyl isomerase [Alphaproteobacteria bacterium]|nr:peptidylprolyl isomerase [Alphaproteobacteria bacterium]
MYAGKKMPARGWVFGLFLVVFGLGAVSAALAQANVAADAPLAVVGGETITEQDLQFAAEDLGTEVDNIPAAERRGFLLGVLIDMKVMAQAARAANMDETEVYLRRRTYLEERALRRAYFEQVIAGSISQEEMEAVYDTMVAGFEPQELIRASHILVATEQDAIAVLEEIRAGRPFEELAREKSADSSGQNGGDLGFFGRGQMVPPFEAAAFALEAGEVSEPVESQFGWHLIRLEERSVSTPPAIAQLIPQIRQQLVFEKFDSIVATLREGAKIEILDPNLQEDDTASTDPGTGG